MLFRLMFYLFIDLYYVSGLPKISRNLILTKLSLMCIFKEKCLNHEMVIDFLFLNPFILSQVPSKRKEFYEPGRISSKTIFYVRKYYLVLFP